MLLLELHKVSVLPPSPSVYEHREFVVGEAGKMFEKTIVKIQ